jgi:hypothetical protein
MNLFGLEIKLANGNGKYVKQKECHEAHDKLENFLSQRFSETNQRIDDFIGSVNNYINLLKNGR